MHLSQGSVAHCKSSPKTQIQVLSDLHLEAGQQYSSYEFPVAAPWLILAGDVGRLVDYEEYLGFLSRQTGRYERVFLVLGNHEFFGLDYQTGIEKARELVQETRLGGKVVLLQRNQWDSPEPDPSITILGCTFWSHIPAHAREVVRNKISDSKKIGGWSVDKHNAQHGEDLGWLTKRLQDLAATAPERRVLVVTHHAPAWRGTSDPRNEDNPWSSAFATGILDGDGDAGRWRQVGSWVFGHTHYPTDFVVGGVRLVANQRGYVLPGSSAHEMEMAGERRTGPHQFDPAFCIDI